MYKKRKKRVAWEPELLEACERDEYFYFIAGYTDGGIPFGTTWE
ncbi:hypothetical protein [Paenibacillus cellulosilyticus]|nr:hypothetical protein [Paenibacillus cellulosilyticus]